MATANIDLTDGTKIVVEGTPDEIARVLELYRCGPSPVPRESASVSSRSERPQRLRRESPSRSRSGAMQYIRALISDQFFAERQSISNVQSKLEELGHIYPLTHLSTPLRRLAQSKELRRLRQGRNWVYVDGH